MNIKYAIIPPLGQSPVQTSEERTKEISKEYLKLSVINEPNPDNSMYVFGWTQNDQDLTEFAIEMDLDYEMNVSNGFNTGYLFQLYGQSTNGQEKAQINQRLNDAVGGKITVGEIIPSSWILYTRQELDNLGW